MKDFNPSMTEEEINSAEVRKSLKSVANYDLKQGTIFKAQPITKTEMYRGKYVTHNKHPLSFREARFIDTYMAYGDLTKAVEAAGFDVKNKCQKGHALLEKDYIADEIAYRNELYASQLVADRDEVMRYFTAVMRGEVKDQFNLDAPLTERTRAAEALAKRLIDDPAKAKQNIAAQQVVVNIDFSRDDTVSPVVDVQQLSD